MAELEKAYYPIVSNWLLKKYQCFKVGVNTGLKHSRADIVGVRDVGGDLTGEIETIIVEVKRGLDAFATASGQAFGYTVYANKIYLADYKPEGFSQDEIQIASHIGVGLIAIGKMNRCVEVLSSPYYRPLTKLNIHLLEKMCLGKCQLCESFIEIGDDKSRYNYVTRENVSKAIELEKGIMFWNRELSGRKNRHGVRIVKENMTYERRFICSDCISLLGQLKK